MPTFSYEVRHSTGQIERGSVEAQTAEAVARQLQEKGYFVVSVQPTARPLTEETFWDSFKRRVLAPVFYPTSSKAIAAYFSSLRALLSAGMNVSEATATLSRRTRSRMLAHAAREMGEAAVQGKPMSGVMRKYPAAFSPATLAAMEAGEQSGLIEQTAERLAKYFDRAFELEQTYRWHTFYPKLLILAAVVIPTAKTLVMEGLGPWMQIVLSRSVPLLALIAVVWYGFRLLLRVPPLRHVLDRIKLLIPWFGSLARRMATARWARALSMLLAAGVPVHRALVAAASATGNKAMESSLAREAEGVLHGRTVSEVIRASREVPDMALDMLGTAERSGSVEGALDKVAEYYESETDVGGKQTAVAIGIAFYLVVALVIAIMVIRFWGEYFAGFGQFME
jgi:type IV pilus assembly protein PilC